MAARKQTEDKPETAVTYAELERLIDNYLAALRALLLAGFRYLRPLG
jgi:hypothetical protein